MKAKIILAALLAVFCGNALHAQGSVSYALPKTVLVFRVDVEQEMFYAGPYARYAQKYLGIETEVQDATRYTITSVSVRPMVEADQASRYSFVPGKSGIPEAFLQLTSQGLVAGVPGSYSEEAGWKYPVRPDADFAGRGIPANLTHASNTLYNKGQETVQQSVVVEKSLEKKAQEVAEMIFKIRENKYKILVGDTDATYSGEAMKATIDALNKLEQDYLTLFTGYSEKGTQSATFEVIPDPATKNQLYVAFRLSDAEGLVPADNVSGRPYYLELKPEPVTVPETSTKAKAGQEVHYRIPAVCKARLTDGVGTLLQLRVPVYQLGVLASWPVTK